ncbi:MAG: cysteine ABC transporter substrate-binding protein [Planctomycetota bacterium]|jgi:polar amino acid transport system substrate-binding protein|nr:cysteine ABC transporter substrate-binding protein [Planctomycetota bacterium]
MKQLTFAIALLFTLLAGSLAWGGSSPDDLRAAGKVRLGVFSDKPPFGFVDSNGKNQGYDVYLGKRLAQDLLGSADKAEFVLVEAASRVEFLTANKVDIILANFTVTPERAEVVDFTKPYMKVALGVVSPDGSVIRSVDQLKGKKLIVNKGTTAEIYFTENHPDIELLKFDQNTETFNALKDGRGAAVAHDNTLLFAWALANPGYTVGIDFLGNQDTIAPAVAKGNLALRQWVDQEIEKLTREGFFKAAYDATLKDAFGASIDPGAVLID